MSVPKQFVFAGSSQGEPWWVLGEVTARLLAPLGYQVQVESRSASTENPRWVGRGDALLGGCIPSTVQWAAAGKHNYAGESFPEFRAIARITRPSWIGVAVTRASRLRSLDQVREQQLPISVLSNNWESVAAVGPRLILEHHGLSRELIESWGGSYYRISGHPYSPYIRENNVDLLILNIYLGHSPVGRYWHEASVLLNLRFLDLDEALIDRLAAETNGERGFIPHNLVRGVDHDVPTVYHEEMIIYGRADLPDDFVEQLARAYDEGSIAFLQTAVHMAYNQRSVAHPSIPLHPAAERYYRQRGYLS
jgi:TRAP-type uncharacterized transport system substrate-binding protein